MREGFQTQSNQRFEFYSLAQTVLPRAYPLYHVKTEGRFVFADYCRDALLRRRLGYITVPAFHIISKKAAPKDGFHGLVSDNPYQMAPVLAEQVQDD